MFSESKKHEKYWRPMIDENGVNKTELELEKVDMSPEELVLHAAMGQAEQWLIDRGHPLPANAKDEKVLIKDMNDSRDLVGDERDRYIETRLAPWYRSQNYASAAQTSLASGTGSNALANVLQLKDEGDPTSRGEGFSLLECSRKQMPESESVRHVELGPYIKESANSPFQCSSVRCKRTSDEEKTRPSRTARCIGMNSSRRTRFSSKRSGRRRGGRSRRRSRPSQTDPTTSGLSNARRSKGKRKRDSGGFGSVTRTSRGTFRSARIESFGSLGR